MIVISVFVTYLTGITGVDKVGEYGIKYFMPLSTLSFDRVDIKTASEISWCVVIGILIFWISIFAFFSIRSIREKC